MASGKSSRTAAIIGVISMANKDAERIARALRRITPSVKAAIAPAVDLGANEIVVKARTAAAGSKDSGTLQGTIRKEPGPKELSVTVKAGGPETTKPVRNSEKGNAPEFDYGLAVEYGTEDTNAQPYFWPSVRALSKRVRRRIDRAASKAVKAEWSK